MGRYVYRHVNEIKYKLADGPTGPQEKWALSDYVIFD